MNLKKKKKKIVLSAIAVRNPDAMPARAPPIMAHFLLIPDFTTRPLWRRFFCSFFFFFSLSGLPGLLSLAGAPCVSPER